MFEFLKRNLPVILIGFVILIAFIAIITFGEAKDSSGPLPNLIKITGFGPDDEAGLGTNEENPDQVASPTQTAPSVPKTEYLIEGQEVPGGLVVSKDGTLISKEEYLQAKTDQKAQEIENAFTIKEASEVDQKFGSLEIVYTTDGFVPVKSHSYTNQLVKWTNGTENIITIIQNNPKYPDTQWVDGVNIEPGSTYEFRTTKTGFWSFREKTTRKAASITTATPYRYGQPTSQ